MTGTTGPAVAAATPVRAGAGVAAATAGAGLLLVPVMVAGTVVPAAAIAGWLLHGIAGAVVCALIGLSARRVRAASVPELVNGSIGVRTGRVVLLCYLAGFTAGQAAIGYVAGGLASVAAGWDSRAGVVAVSLTVLAVSVAVAAAGPPWKPWARRVRLAATVPVAGYLCLHPALATGAGLFSGVTVGSAAAAVFLMLFAFVGWERIARLAPLLASPRATVAAAILGAAVVTTVYLTLTLLAGNAAGEDLSGALSATDRVVGVLAVVILAAYCVTNLAAAGEFVRLLGRPARWAPLAVALAAGAALSVAAAAGWRAGTLLLVPATAAWAGYSLALVAAFRHGGWLVRTAALTILVAAAALAGAVGHALLTAAG